MVAQRELIAAAPWFLGLGVPVPVRNTTQWADKVRRAGALDNLLNKEQARQQQHQDQDKQYVDYHYHQQVQHIISNGRPPAPVPRVYTAPMTTIHD